jgi:hypothetical protein
MAEAPRNIGASSRTARSDNRWSPTAPVPLFGRPASARVRTATVSALIMSQATQLPWR